MNRFVIFGLLLTLSCPVMANAQEDSLDLDADEFRLADDLVRLDPLAALSMPAGLDIKFHSFGRLEDEVRNDLMEDAATLNQLVKEALPDRRRRSLGIAVNQRIRANYVEGAGMLFFYHVNFMLTPSMGGGSGGAGDEGPEKKKSAWERARDQVRGTQNRVYLNRVGNVQQMDGAAAKYDEDTVGEIKLRMKQALSHAGNFRNLGPDDRITIFVYGPGAANNQRSVMAWRVSLSDASADGKIPESKIELKQYFERVSSAYDRVRFTDESPLDR